MTAKGSDSVGIRLLAILPPVEFSRFQPKLQPVDLSTGRMPSTADMPLEQVYFPDKGMISLVRPMLDGAMVEVGVVGREGFLGMGAVLGGDVNILGKMVQIQGSALGIPISVLRLELEQCPILKAQLLTFLQALLSQVSQSTACNGRHRLQVRLARRLLMAGDRADGDVMTLSHEFLSMMLGVRRSGIAVALGKFKSAGLIRYSHGKIEIVDRGGLEAAACECYGSVRDEYKRLLH